MHKLPAAQEVFNIIVAHLFKQNRRAQNADGDGCAYRDGELRCAVGVLIPDDLYSPNLEGNDAQHIIKYFLKSGIADWVEHEELLGVLQKIHDNCDTLDDGTFDQENLKYRLRDCAYRFSLECSW